MRRSGDSQDGLCDIASDVASRSVAFDANDPVAPKLKIAADLATTEEAAILGAVARSEAADRDLRGVASHFKLARRVGAGFSDNA
jgi:hypothetical protein